MLKYFDIKMQICNLICFVTTIIARITLLLHYPSIEICIKPYIQKTRKQIFTVSTASHHSISASACLNPHSYRQQSRPHLSIGGLRT